MKQSRHANRSNSARQTSEPARTLAGAIASLTAARKPLQKYRIKITWVKEAEVEAENKEEAINIVLHNGAKPRLDSAHAKLSDAKQRAYIQTFRALPRWEKWYIMRKRGMKYREIGKEEGVTAHCVHRGVMKYESHLLNTLTNAR